MTLKCIQIVIITKLLQEILFSLEILIIFTIQVIPTVYIYLYINIYMSRNYIIIAIS